MALRSYKAELSDVRVESKLVLPVPTSWLEVAFTLPKYILESLRGDKLSSQAQRRPSGMGRLRSFAGRLNPAKSGHIGSYIPSPQVYEYV